MITNAFHADCNDVKKIKQKEENDAELTLTVICDDFCPKAGLLGEHGFSVFIETVEARIIFDSGQGLAFRHNAVALGLAQQPPQAVVISHGHDDHAGGLQILAETYQKPLPVILHPDAFQQRYKFVDNNNAQATGIPFSRQHLQDLGLQMQFNQGPLEVAPHIWVTGQIPRPFKQPVKLSHFTVDANGEKQADRFLDDQALAIETSKGLVVVLGCAHAGVQATLEHISSFLPGRPFFAVIGGMHLLRSNDAAVIEVAQYLNEKAVQLVAASHCTGIAQEAVLGCHVYGDFSVLSVGAKLKF